MSETVYVRIGPDLESNEVDNLQLIQGAVDELSQREAWPENLTFKVNLVLEEVGLNILTHGAAGTERRPEIEIVLTSEDDSLTIEVSDDGYPFNPLQDAAQPDIKALLDHRSIGGLGVHLVRTLMDDMTYQRTGGKNRLTLIAKRE